MKEFNPNIENNGQFKLDLQNESEVITSNDNEQHDDVTHLGPDDLIKMQVDEPVEYEAIMAEMKRQLKLIEEKKELEEIERLALEAEERENSEKSEINKQKEVDELRASIAKAYENDSYDKDDDPGEYRHFAEIAREKQQNKDKKITGGIKKGGKKWNKNWGSIQSIFKRDNLR